jgi:hypothetical protein
MILIVALLFCAGNISVVNKNQLMIANLGGIKHFAAALESPFESCQRFACRVLYRIAAHPLNQQPVKGLNRILMSVFIRLRPYYASLLIVHRAGT